MTVGDRTSQNLGDVTVGPDGAAVELERTIPASPDAVWAALTVSDELERWLAPAAFDAKVGGTVEIRFAADQIVSGEVTICEPPSDLEYTWRIAGEGPSVVRFWLAGVEDGTSLRVVHRKLPAQMAAGYAAGWHAYADRLAAAMEGSPLPDWDTRFAEVLPRYIEALTA